MSEMNPGTYLTERTIQDKRRHRLNFDITDFYLIEVISSFEKVEKERLMMKNEDITSRYISLVNSMRHTIDEFSFTDSD